MVIYRQKSFLAEGWGDLEVPKPPSTPLGPPHSRPVAAVRYLCNARRSTCGPSWPYAAGSVVLALGTGGRGVGGSRASLDARLGRDCPPGLAPGFGFARVLPGWLLGGWLQSPRLWDLRTLARLETCHTGSRSKLIGPQGIGREPLFLQIFPSPACQRYRLDFEKRQKREEGEEARLHPQDVLSWQRLDDKGLGGIRQGWAAPAIVQSQGASRSAQPRE